MKRKRILIGLSVLVITILTTYGFTTLNSVASASGYQIGDSVKDFKLKNVDGRTISLSDYKEAKGYIVIFTCNSCPYSVANEDRIIALDKEFRSKGFPVIAINPNNPKVVPEESYEMMQKRAKSKGFSFPYLYDDSKSVYATFGATKTPHVYLLQKESEDIVVKYIGAIDDSSRNAAEVKVRFLANAIYELLSGKEISVKETRALGCSIKA